MDSAATQDPRSSPAAVEAMDRLLALTGGLHHLLADVAARYDLTPQQAVVLRSLSRPRRMRVMADEMRCDPSNVTGLIDRIERLGLVERVPDPADRRVRLLSLTDSGRRVREDMQRDLLDALALQRLTSSELGQLLVWLRRLTTASALACAADALGCDLAASGAAGGAIVGADSAESCTDTTSRNQPPIEGPGLRGD